MAKRQRKKKEKIGVRSTKVIVTTIGKGEEVEQVEKEVEVFEVEPAYISVKAGVTRSLAQYESIRIDVSIMMPCYKELIEETYESVADTVSEMLENEVDQYLNPDDNDG